MVQADEAALQLFIAHQQLVEAVKPTVRNLDNPAARFLVWVVLQIQLLLMATFDVRDVTIQLNQLQRGFPGITCIRTQVLRAALDWHFPLYHDPLQHGSDLSPVVLSVARARTGTSGSTRFQNSSVTSHDFTLPIITPVRWNHGNALLPSPPRCNKVRQSTVQQAGRGIDTASRDLRWHRPVSSDARWCAVPCGRACPDWPKGTLRYRVNSLAKSVVRKP